MEVPELLQVPGLRNLGNTCFLAAVLQALASCASLLDQLRQAARVLKGLPPLPAALLDCLERLQPVAAGAGGAPASESPAEVLYALRQHIGADTLPEGQEHDAVEAFEILMGLVGTDLQRAFAACCQLPLEARGSLMALLQPAGAPAAAIGEEAVCDLGQTDVELEGSAAVSRQGPGPAAEADVCNGSCPNPAHEGVTVSAPQDMLAAEQPGSAALAAGAQHGSGGGPAGGPNSAAPACNSSLPGCEPAEDVQPAGSSSPVVEKNLEASVEEARRLGSSCSSPGHVQTSGAPALGAEQEEPMPDCDSSTSRTQQDPPQQQQPQNSTGCSAAADCEERLTLPERDEGNSAGFAHVDSVLSSFQALTRLLCEGTLASELQCLRCRHHFTSQLTPFLAMPLSIPLAPARGLLSTVLAAPGLALGDCLGQFFGYEMLQGVACTRCSLQATLVAAESAGLPPQLRSLQEALEQRLPLLESDVHQEAAQAAGLAWVVQRGPVAKRQLMARLPGILCLQLKRTCWTELGEAKVAGHVRFPLAFQLGGSSVPLLGHAPAPSPLEGHSSSGGQGAARQPDLVYGLRAVVVHFGSGAGRGGHYVVYRCLDAAQRTWARVSDERATSGASLQEVLGADATLLVYERCGGP